MRKLVVSVNMTLDGFFSGPSGEMDWHLNAWSEDMARPHCDQLARADTILLGRVTYQAMAAYWPLTTQHPEFAREDLAFADMMNNHRKVVFTQTLAEANWRNTELIAGRLLGNVRALKREPGKDIVVYGSGKLVGALMAAGLVDVYALWLHPVALGRGRALFSRPPGHLNLQLISSRSFRSGVVNLVYEKADPLIR